MYVRINSLRFERIGHCNFRRKLERFDDEVRRVSTYSHSHDKLYGKPENGCEPARKMSSSVMKDEMKVKAVNSVR